VQGDDAGEALLIDPALPETEGFAAWLAACGYPVRGVLLTHRHVAGQGGNGALPQLALGAPVGIELAGASQAGQAAGMRDATGAPPQQRQHAGEAGSSASGPGMQRQQQRQQLLPVYLHPADAAHIQAVGTAFATSGGTFSDPCQAVDAVQSGSTASDNASAADAASESLLQRAGLQCINLPGHTEGSVIARWPAHGGVLFVGDCGMGPALPDAASGRLMLERPPHDFSDNDGRLRQSWRSLLARAGLLPVGLQEQGQAAAGEMSGAPKVSGKPGPASEQASAAATAAGRAQPAQAAQAAPPAQPAGILGAFATVAPLHGAVATGCTEHALAHGLLPPLLRPELTPSFSAALNA
jgi:glyoxylase-like metal-dependent hydrolase (beta-lactamase superfamily II)